MKNKYVTAEELMTKLQNDPMWVARQEADDRERQRLQDEFLAMERPVLADLRAAGVVVPSLGNAKDFASYMPLSPKIVAVLLHWLPLVHWRLKEPIARLLAASAEAFDGTVLADEFDKSLLVNTDDLPTAEAISLGDLRWAIANTIAEARPYGIGDWILKTVMEPSLGKSKEMLLFGLARLLPQEQAREILTQFFEEFPSHCANGLAELGANVDLEFLEESKAAYGGEIRKGIERAIKSLKRGRKGKKAEKERLP